MVKNMPGNEVYEKISEWLKIYKTTDNPRKKTKVKTLIVAQMIPVVKNIARSIARRSTDPFEDMVQAGFIGLLKAIDNYSPDKNDNFKIYAGYLIIGEIKHYLRDKLNTIRVPRHIQELTIRINNFTRNLSPEELETLTSEDVASALKISTDAVNKALEADRRRSTISLEDVFISDNDTVNYEDLIPDRDYKEQAEFEDARILFESVIDRLPEDEKLIIDMYYKQDMTKKEIAERLTITPMMVTRKMRQALNIIASMISEDSQPENPADNEEY